MVATRSPAPKSPASTKLRSPRSPRTNPSEGFAPPSSVLADKPATAPDMHQPHAGSGEATTPASPPRGYLLRRVLSGGSSAASGSASASASAGGSGSGSPAVGNAPPSPGSPGARTPRAEQEKLRPEGEGQQLATDMDGLKVRSPGAGLSSAGGGEVAGAGALGITQVLNSGAGPVESPAEMGGGLRSVGMGNGAQASGSGSGAGNGNGGMRAPARSYSSSTDSSSSAHPVPPSHLGSSYGSEGFPAYNNSPENSPMPYVPYIPTGNGYLAGGGDPELAARQAAALAKADEAVRQLNGTATLFQGPGAGAGAGVGANAEYQIPRNYASFVTPHTSNPAVTRQSSTSSSTDAASTSSEESDWCIPTIEWVPANQNSASPGFGHSPYLNSPGTVFAQREKDRASSAGRMPPPASTNKNSNASPRKATVDAPPLTHQYSLPMGASANTPPPGSATHPTWVTAPSESVDEDDDDAATVGHGRERSPSTSSQSAQSGLDLLWRAAHGIAPTVGYDASYDQKGKRKAGAEAVAQWRSSGIPTGVPPGSAGAGAGKPKVHRETQSATPASSGGPPKKRRRSEHQMEEMKPEPEAYDDDEDELAAEQSSDDRSLSTSEEEAGSGDSDYGGGKRGRPIVGRGGRGRGRGGAAARGRGGAAAAAAVNPATAPGGVTKGGSIKKVRKVGETPSEAAKGGRRPSASIPAGGVQCEYVNPLPASHLFVFGQVDARADSITQPYNRCTDVFTRKYDLPRHMARHARREGELVMEGKLTEEKAVLWRTIKDKPKVTCNSCGESFTRMDALKRHQAKQHHS